MEDAEAVSWGVLRKAEGVTPGGRKTQDLTSHLVLETFLCGSRPGWFGVATSDRT